MHEADFDASLKQIITEAVRTGLDQNLIVVSLKAAIYQIESADYLPGGVIS